MVSVLLGTAGLAAAVIFNFVECLNLAIARDAALISARARSEISRVVGLGISCSSGVGFLRTLAAFVPRNCKTRRSIISSRSGSGSDGSIVRRCWIVEASNDPAGFERSRHRVRTASHTTASRATKGSGDSSQLSVVHSACLCVAGDRRLDEYLGRLCRSARRHLGCLSPRSDGWFCCHDGLLDRAAHSSAFWRGAGIFSKRLMFLSLLLLQTGCTLRVFSEPLAYEGLLPLHGRCCLSQECWS